MSKTQSPPAPLPAGMADAINACVDKAFKTIVQPQIEETKKAIADVKSDPKRPTIDVLMAMQLPQGMKAAYASTEAGAPAGYVPAWKRCTKMVGSRTWVNPETREAKSASFGDFVRDCYYANPITPQYDRTVTEAQQEEARERLKALGVMQYQRSAWDKSADDLTRAGVRKTALAEASGAAGGYTVPPMFYDELFRYAVEPTILYGKVKTVPMTARTLQVPVLDQETAQSAGVSAFLAGMQALWEQEAASIGEYEPAFRQLELTAWTLGVVSVASIQLLQDNAIGMDGLMTELLTATIGWTADYAFFQGNGVGKPLGVVNAPATVTVTRDQSNQFSLKDAAQMVGKLYAGLYQGSQIWCMHQSVYPYLIKLNDESGNTANTGRLAWLPFDQGAVGKLPTQDGPWSVGTLFGRPVYLTEKLPAVGSTADVMLIDLNSYVCGDRMELEIDVSPHVKFQNAQLMWRALARLDGQPYAASAITLADGAQTVSGLVALHS